jgi:hypothetical protein
MARQLGISGQLRISESESAESRHPAAGSLLKGAISGSELLVGRNSCNNLLRDRQAAGSCVLRGCELVARPCNQSPVDVHCSQPEWDTLYVAGKQQ